MNKIKLFLKTNPVSAKCIFLALFCVLLSGVGANALMSQDGIIQNVQTYSSNPFWQNGSNSYRQQMPSVVYATGTAVKNSDCQTLVMGLVSSYCMYNNNCASMRLTDIRPAIMLQLSKIPGGNYATACAGYLDTAFDNYQKNNKPAPAIGGASFPTPTTVNPTATTPTVFSENPYQQKTPDWQSEMMERKLELQQLQAANGTTTPQVRATSFPVSASDIPYEDRIANAKQGYDPYAGKSAFVQLKIEDEEDYLARKNKKAEEHDSQNFEEFCKKYPNHSNCKKDDPDGKDDKDDNDENDENNNELPVHDGEIPVDITK
ncbi:MAG: hypothetical protein IJE79_00460 [Alphaproteobacteria bacterium]|nr:hypothetical protein [Alphaproteobacteria bacterium]